MLFTFRCAPALRMSKPKDTWGASSATNSNSSARGEVVLQLGLTHKYRASFVSVMTFWSKPTRTTDYHSILQLD